VSSPELRIVDDPARACADALVQAVRSGGHVVLTGGSTPKLAYELAALEPAAFAGAKLWFGDDRCVGPDDERSNYRMAKLALLDPVAAAGVEIDFCRRIMGELGPDEGAADYERALAEHGAPPFKLILLGLGSDGHTASMFPGQASLHERSRLVMGVHEAGLEPFVPRVTFTFPCIARAEHVIVLATGENKADAVARAFAPDAVPSDQTPASLLAADVESLTVLLDVDAASRL
jgi:6-phosphogluconolactonase